MLIEREIMYLLMRINDNIIYYFNKLNILLIFVLYVLLVYGNIIYVICFFGFYNLIFE